MAPVALFLVTINVFLATTTTTSVLSAVDRDRNKKVCLPPAENGVFNTDCGNGSTLPPDTPSNVQVDVLSLPGKQLYDAYQQGNYDACTVGTVSGIAFSVYGGCKYGLDSIRCQNCVRDATLVIYQYCRDSVAAQAVSDSCCVRYDRDYTIC
ncbi:unnamed protein product [Linum trigynum]|uniref:Gnk2-homologous domain-containing protein n=1 Tax=Linum trigynum TaxID=586398 RepID=A0AAV2CVZ3_9ROSI